MTAQTEAAWIEEAMRLADRAGVAAMYEAMSAITSVATEASYAHAMALLRAHLATRPAAAEADHVEQELARAQGATPIQWPVGREAGRAEDMGDGWLRIVLDSDNDVCVSVWDGRRSAGIEFCNPGACGGGRSSRTRMALIALMVAIEADNANSPLPQRPLPIAAATGSTK